MKMPTIEEFWKHLSNKVFAKCHDPHLELFSSVIPIDVDGNFLDPISSDVEPYCGDPYSLLRDLATSRISELPTKSFGFFSPGWMRKLDMNIDEDDPRFPQLMENAERIQMFAFMLVTDYENIDFGVWNMEDNTIDLKIDGETAGQLAASLKALSFGWVAQNDIDSLGEMAGPIREAMEKLKALEILMNEIHELRNKE